MNDTLTRGSWQAWLPWLILLGGTALLQGLDAYLPLRLGFPPTLAQCYRLCTCHFVHLNFHHWLVDALALLVLAWLFVAVFDWKRWLLTLLIGGACVSLGLLLWHPGLHSYAGLSGVLHAFYVTGSLLLWRRQPRLTSLLIGVLVLKLAIEPFTGSLLQGAAGFPVATLAHDYGAFGGLLSGLLWLSLYARRRH